jgi:hypothetical protein
VGAAAEYIFHKFLSRGTNCTWEYPTSTAIQKGGGGGELKIENGVSLLLDRTYTN